MNNLEILDKARYDEYESFVRCHPGGGITQSILWHGVKPDWLAEVVVVRDDDSKIVAGISILVRKIPGLRISMLYAPRGPVCDLYNSDIMRDIKLGVDLVAKKHRAYVFKMDPEALICDEAIFSGYRRFYGPTGFETIQTRFNYRLYLKGRDEDALFANLHHKTRYNVRVARKHGVEVKIGGREDLDEFARLMKITGKRDGFAVRSQAYFENMLNALGEHARLYMAYYQGKAVSGAVTTNYAGKTCYIYGASDNEHRNVMPNYLLQWEMIRWAAETGCTVYDFQGVDGTLNEDKPLYGLYRFKRGFGGQIDELAGEFDYVYMPVRNWLVNTLIALKSRLKR